MLLKLVMVLAIMWTGIILIGCFIIAYDLIAYLLRDTRARRRFRKLTMADRLGREAEEFLANGCLRGHASSTRRTQP